jgi:AcrR family transcriptional regulator
MVSYKEPVPRARRAAAPAARDDAPRARLDVDERRKQLLELGVQTFGHKSYDEVSIDELAAAAGISKGLLYHYFPTKKDFYVATVRESAQRFVERTTRAGATSDKDPLARLQAGLDGYLDYVVEHQAPYAALLRSGVGVDPEVARIVDDTRATLTAQLLEGTAVDAGDPLMRLAVRGWLGFVEHATLSWLDGKRRVARAQLRDLLASVLLAALQGAAK